MKGKLDIKRILLICFVVVFVVLFFSVSFAVETKIKLEIVPGQITYDSPDYLNLGQINLTQTQQNIQGQFTDYFWVSDLMGADTGYITNIVCDGLVGPNAITLTGIYLMAGNNGSPDLLAGISGDVKISSVFSGGYYPIFNTPVTYIYRQLGANYGKINKYGDRPWIRVIIPPYTQPGTYSGTIYFDI